MPRHADTLDQADDLERKAAKYDILADALKVICDPSNWDGIYLPRIDCQAIAEHALLEAAK